MVMPSEFNTLQKIRPWQTSLDQNAAGTVSLLRLSEIDDNQGVGRFSCAVLCFAEPSLHTEGRKSSSA